MNLADIEANKKPTAIENEALILHELAPHQYNDHQAIWKPSRALDSPANLLLSFMLSGLGFYSQRQHNCYDGALQNEPVIPAIRLPAPNFLPKF